MMRWALVRIFASLMLCSQLMAGEVVGWRGDGTGRNPTATPPVSWSRTSELVTGLRVQAAKPAGTAAAGNPMPDGVIKDWLIAGPFTPVAGTKPIEQEYLGTKDAQLTPGDGEAAGEQVWKATRLDNSLLDFGKAYPGSKGAVAYAHAYLWSPSAGKVGMYVSCRSPIRVWVNGESVFNTENPDDVHISLLAGWNRILLKSVQPEATWGVRLNLAAMGGGYVNRNIQWQTLLPGKGCGSPIVVGDKVFLLSEPGDLSCVDASTGRILWVRSNNYFDTIGDEERSKDPAYKPLEALAAQLKVLNDSFAAPRPPAGALPGIGEGRDVLVEKGKLDDQIHAALKKMDKDRFKRPNRCDVGYAGATPVSDGTNVYVWCHSGVTACYDLAGNRKWIRLENQGRPPEHGNTSSPSLVDGKMIIYTDEAVALDAATGAVVWRCKINEPDLHASFCTVRIGNVAHLVLDDGKIVRVSDGKIVFSDQRLLGRQLIPTPVNQGDRVYLLANNGRLSIVKLPSEAGDPLNVQIVKQVDLDLSKFPKFYCDWQCASPLFHEGLLYFMNVEGVLSVVDAESGATVYQRMLDLDPIWGHNLYFARGLGISPSLGGKYIYFTGNCGTTVVLEPGREFKQVSKNWIEQIVVPGHWSEHRERGAACFVFKDDCMFYHGEFHLYCLKEK